MKIRQYFIIYSFISLCLVSVGLTSIGYFENFYKDGYPKESEKENLDMEESYFKNIVYFLIESSSPKITFNSDSLTFSSVSKKAISTNPKGHIFREKNEDPIQFEANFTNVNLDKKFIQLEDKVKINLDNLELHSNLIKVYTAEDLIEAFGAVQTLSTSRNEDEQILIKSSQAMFKPKQNYIEYRNGVEGTLKRKKVYEESIKFNSDAIDFDGAKSLINLLGDVHLIRSNYDIFANQGSVFLENYNKKLKYYSFSDDVRLEERVNSNNRTFTRRAFSEKLEGIMSEKKIILSGLPKVFQDKDVIKGNLIVIRENVETVEVDDANTNITLKQDAE